MVRCGDRFHGAKSGLKRTPKFLELIAEIRAKSRPIFTPGSRRARGAAGAECAGRKFEVKSAHFCANCGYLDHAARR